MIPAVRRRTVEEEEAPGFEYLRCCSLRCLCDPVSSYEPSRLYLLFSTSVRSCLASRQVRDVSVDPDSKDFIYLRRVDHHSTAYNPYMLKVSACQELSQSGHRQKFDAEGGADTHATFGCADSAVSRSRPQGAVHIVHQGGDCQSCRWL